MEAGQPSTNAPSKVTREAQRCLEQNEFIGYTNAIGIPPLRHAIAEHYRCKYGIQVSAEQVVVTTGSSAAFLFAFLGCFDPSDCIALCSSGYPCYRNLMKATNLVSVSIPVNKHFKVTAVEIASTIAQRVAEGLPPLKGLILSSPSNPTGAMLTPAELAALCALCDKHGILFISDEIYHGISYGEVSEATALAYSSSALVINSFSKYYSMTGWRLGWMIVPPSLVSTMTRLSQNMYINAPTLSQLAAVHAFDCEDELQGNVAGYRASRDLVLAALEELGLLEGASPADGAFYVYVDVSARCSFDSLTLCSRLLDEAGLAITPGVDFEDPASGLGLRRIRLSYSRRAAEVAEGMDRFKAWWRKNVEAKQ